jgi:hypothetical protein
VWEKPAKEDFLLRLLRKFYSKYNSEIPYRKFLSRVFPLHRLCMAQLSQVSTLLVVVVWPLVQPDID